MNVIQFLSKEEIDGLVDETAYTVIEYLLGKVAFSQVELSDDDINSNLQITKEFLEDWVAQACGLKKQGAGNYPIDVYKENDFGVDVKFMSTKSQTDNPAALTNETSLGQNFKEAGFNLDQMFDSGSCQEILDGWKKILTIKSTKPRDEFGLNKIYYFFFLREGNTIYLAVAESHPEAINELAFGKLTRQSLIINKMVEERYGKANIYKSKKRMELRLKLNALKNDSLVIEWNFDNFHPDRSNLREMVKKGEMGVHIKSQINKFFGEYFE